MPIYKNSSRRVAFQSLTTSGSANTSTLPTTLVSLDGNPFTPTSSIPTHVGNGCWQLVLTSGEMNADLVALTASAAGCVPSEREFYTEADWTSARAVKVDNADVAVSSRFASLSYTAPPTTAAIAAAILATPTNPIATDSGGRVNVAKWLDQPVTLDANNLPNVNTKDYGGTVVSGGLPISGAVTLDFTSAIPASTTFNTIGRALKNCNDNLDYPLSAINSNVSNRPTLSSIASAILVNPANPISTDSAGRTTVAGYAAGQDPGSYLTTQGFTTVRTANLDKLDVPVSTRVASSTFAAMTSPPTPLEIASAILASPLNKLMTDATGAVSLNMNQSVPLANTSQTLGDALNAARAQGFGQWVLDGPAKTLKLFGPDGVTVVRTFTLDSATATTVRA